MMSKSVSGSSMVMGDDHVCSSLCVEHLKVLTAESVSKNLRMVRHFERQGPPDLDMIQVKNQFLYLSFNSSI